MIDINTLLYNCKDNCDHESCINAIQRKLAKLNPRIKVRIFHNYIMPTMIDVAADDIIRSHTETGRRLLDIAARAFVKNHRAYCANDVYFDGARDIGALQRPVEVNEAIIKAKFKN